MHVHLVDGNSVSVDVDIPDKLEPNHEVPEI